MWLNVFEPWENFIEPLFIRPVGLDPWEGLLADHGTALEQYARWEVVCLLRNE
jgi:hypothetical protein